MSKKKRDSVNRDKRLALIKKVAQGRASIRDPSRVAAPGAANTEQAPPDATDDDGGVRFRAALPDSIQRYAALPASPQSSGGSTLQSPLGNLLPGSKERRKHKEPRAPRVVAPASILRLHSEAESGVLMLRFTPEGRASAISLDRNPISDRIKSQLRLLAKRPTFLWERLQALCTSGRTLNDEAEWLTSVVVYAWSEIGRNHLWNSRLGKSKKSGVVVEKKWGKKVAQEQSKNVADDARRLIRSLELHRDLLGVPNTQYWRSRDFERTSIDASNPLLPNAPPIWILLRELALVADTLARSYGAKRHSKSQREMADLTSFLHGMCIYLDARYATAATNLLANIAHYLTDSAFPELNGNYIEAARTYLRDEVRHKEKAGGKAQKKAAIAP